MTYDQHPNSHVPPTKHPESPSREPSVAVKCRLWQDSIFEESAEGRTVVAVMYANNCYSKLQIIKLVYADINRTLEVASKKEK